MVRREVNLPRPDEQRLLYAVRGLDADAEFMRLRVSDRARRVAGAVLGVLVGDSDAAVSLQEEFLREAPKKEKGSDEKVASYKKLDEKLESVERVAEEKEEKGEDANRLRGFIENNEQLLWDIEEGVALALQYRMNRQDPADEELRESLRGGNYERVEEILSGVDGGGVLAGVMERLAGRIVTTPEALEILGDMGNIMDKSGNILENRMENVQRKIRTLYSKGEIEASEAATLENYLYWVMVEGGQVDRVSGDDGSRQYRGEYGIVLPHDFEGQLGIVRPMLEKIESTMKTTRDLALASTAAALEEITTRGDVNPEVAKEIRARLSLHDCAVLMKKANGYVEAPRSGGDPECPTVGMAATLAEGMGHALNSESISFLLKERGNGIPVAAAWDLYQDVNINYRAVLREIEEEGEDLMSSLRVSVDGDPDLGTIDATYFTDGDANRKAKVDQYVVGRIMDHKGVSELVARKAWDMAKKLALATGENSIFNSAMTGNDEMAEDIYLKVYRWSRNRSGRPRGPQIHVQKIVGIGNSWLRRVSGVEPANKDGLVPLYARDVVVFPGSGNGMGIEEGSMVYHYGVWWSAKIHPLRGLLLDRQPEADKICSKDFMQGAVDYFNKADPDGSKRLRYFWAGGVLDMACSNGDLGWTQKDISKFRQFLVTEPLSDQAGTFLSRSDWDELMDKGDFAGKMLKLDVKRALQGAFEVLSAGGGGGGRKKR